MSDNIKVVVKVRPLISRELEDKQHHQWRVQSNTLYQLDSNGRDFGQSFTFDKVYNEDTKTSDVYNDIAKPIVEAATAGFNGTIFAYGQTSSGKTYTMTGTDTSPGIIPLSVINLFKIIKNVPDRDFLVRVSYIEIYNETVKDLLDVKKENIKIHETYEGSIKVDATEKVTSSPDEVLEAMREGEANRQTGSTNMNEKSSRSHSIFQITIESREHIEGTEEAGCVNVSQLNLVDLAGSERAGQTGATGIRFKEGTHINKSLSALALVIKQLSEDPNKYANYRDSKLTRILQNSLGGNAKTSIICAITPAALEETVSTLQFATRAKAIKNKPEVNAVATDATMIQSLTKQLSRLQSQLESKKNLEVMLENKKNVEQDLQKQIANLQKLILNGFGQRSNIEQMGGARRKQPPRRITISTLSLHPIEEDPVPVVPKFRTPSLKYNPMVIPNPAEFAPSQGSSKLPTLPEEPPRLITPPPNDKKVNFSDEVIEIDSDDDNESSIPTCSPYHKCYTVSKTPPCVLRKNCHQAEKNYREIVEFTEREKMFKPDVVELMEKLEYSTNMAAKFQEEINVLKKNSKEKELEMEHLMFKIKKAEEDCKNVKVELETRSQEYNTKLTDCEVSYEILKNKAKLREQELLSLLDEQKHKKCEDIGKLPPNLVENDRITFMDMSKDISLVNSDNESSIITSNQEELSDMKNLVASLQDQLIDKCQTIIQLEANIASQKQSIEFLEQSTDDLQKMIDSFKEKNIYLESENKLYKSNIDALNDTIKSQKEVITNAQNDIASYNDVIQDLKLKLTEKDNILNTSITDSFLENMIANEEKVIANNENMKNIIHSFKIALDKRNKEIEQLKSSLNETETSHNSPNHATNDKMPEINELVEENAKLKDDVNNNIITINNLMREKNNLASLEEELTKKYAELENKKIELDELNKENILRIEDLNNTNQSLLQSLSDKNLKEEEYVQLNNKLQNKLDEMSHTVAQLEEEISEKNETISSLININNNKQECEDHAKSALEKLKSVLSILRGDVQEIPEFIENCVTLFNALSNGLCLLENVATDTVSEKNTVASQNSQLKTEIMNLQNTFEVEKNTLQHEIDELKQIIDNYLKEIVKLKDTNKELSNEIICEYQKEIQIKNTECDTLVAQCNSLKNNVKELTEELVDKREDLMSLNEKANEYKVKIQDLEAKLLEYEAALKIEQEQLKLKTEILSKTLESNEKLDNEIKEKRDECIMLQKSLDEVQDEQYPRIFNRLCNVANSLNIDISFPLENEDPCDSVLLLLDQISNETAINENNSKRDLDESKKSVEILLNDNEKLSDKLTKLEKENNSLCDKLQNYDLEMKNLGEKLIESNEILKQLKEDLENKTFEIQAMENQVKEWKDQFTNLDILMKQQIQDLRNENEILKARYQNEEENLHTLSCRKSVNAVCENKISNVKTITPPSLLTICCNKIVDAMEPKQNVSTPSTSDTEIRSTAKCATCDHMSLEVRILEQEKSSLLGVLEQSERDNKALLLEQENIRREIQLLIEPSQELQKKISSHKTNLSILTATTYAENRSLKSQVLALRHHHGKLLNVCQGDIPEFKKQLRDLFVMLKSDSFVSENQNANFKRYSLPDVLDNNTTDCNFKNESTLDGDLLMLDTNITLTTTGDNTLVGCDQSCSDLNQTMFNEPTCEPNDPKRLETNIINSNISLLESDSKNMFSSLEVLKEENRKLKALVDKLSLTRVSEPKVDAQSSPIKAASSSVDNTCTEFEIYNKTSTHADIEKEVLDLRKTVDDLRIENQIIEKKYNDLVLEMPKTDALVSKLKSLENEYDVKLNELIKLTNTLNSRNKELKRLQEENDTLSTQVMENISEADDLNKELNRINSQNLELSEKVRQMESNMQIGEFECPQCRSLITEKKPNKDSPHVKLNRSLSDSETSSRFNKISTLQSELCAGREDCKVLTEHVATIKQHFNCSNMTMELDESIGDSKVSQPKNGSTPNSQQIMCNMPHIQEEKPVDIYTADKMECYNYYLEITGEDNEKLSDDVKIIDIIKMFYSSLLEEHANKVEKLAKKNEEFQDLLKMQIDEMTAKYTAVTKTLEEKEESLSRVSKFMTQLKNNIYRIKNELVNKDDEAFIKAINMLKQNVLNNLDYEFGISSASVFEVLIGKLQEDLNNTKEQCRILEAKKSNVDLECGVIEELKLKLAELESAYNLLKAQKEKMVEISSAVTLDIVNKELQINKTLHEGCKKLLQQKLITPDLALSESASHNIDLLIDHLLNKSQLDSEQKQTETNMLTLKVNVSTNIIHEKEKELDDMKAQLQSLRDINNNITTELADKEVTIQTLKTAHEDLNKAYDSKIQDNINKLNEIDKLIGEISSLRETITDKDALISTLSEKNDKYTELFDLANELKESNAKLTEEVANLKETIKNKESLITSLSEKNAKTTELLHSIRELQDNNDKLKSINEIITKEREAYSIDLQKSSETIKQNVAEIAKMTSDILILRESVKDATSIIDSLKQEVQKLTVVNAELKLSLEEKKRECLRLEVNIKTHDKTAELQSKMIIRLNKQKEEDDRLINEKQLTINEVNEKFNSLQDECEKLKSAKESLEARVSELQEAAERPRASLDSAETSRRRRQSIHDSKRLLADLDEQRNLEAVFESRQKPDDLFSEGDHSSGRSTPFLARGSDSLLSRTEHSDKDEDHSSRPSSVQAARRRRQSIHDLHRGVVRHTPSPHDFSGRDNSDHPKDTSGSRNDSSEVSELRAQLTSCQQELEELKERYRELDEECETCAEYLRERDELCSRLKKEKTALEKQIMELKSNNAISSEKPSVAHVAVNTDEDWANLHSVVVDRMSYDAEVDKNKRLTKTIEELRYQKQDLKNTLAKMQKALEKQHSNKDNRELEATKKELRSVKEELEELKVKYKELDEECETCAEYLKEREEQCRRLKEAKAALESKLQELQEDSQVLAHYSVRKKRQTVHDMHRSSAMDQTDASTETNEDLLSSQVERDDSSLKETDDKLREIKRLRMLVDKLNQQRAAMEQQLKTAPAPMYVATGSGIVQNQQLTDVIKENQRLKKMNAKLVNICKKRGKSDANRENEDPCEQG